MIDNGSTASAHVKQVKCSESGDHGGELFYLTRSHNANYVNERVAENIGGVRYKELMNIKLGDGSHITVSDFFCVEIKIKLNEEIYRYIWS